MLLVWQKEWTKETPVIAFSIELDDSFIILKKEKKK